MAKLGRTVLFLVPGVKWDFQWHFWTDWWTLIAQLGSGCWGKFSFELTETVLLNSSVQNFPMAPATWTTNFVLYMTGWTKYYPATWSVTDCSFQSQSLYGHDLNRPPHPGLVGPR